MTFLYSEKPSISEQEQVKFFFTNFDQTISCKKCREHFKKYLKEHPIDVSQKSKLIDWMIEYHNHVNQQIPKKTSWNHQQVYSLYQVNHQAYERFLIEEFDIDLKNLIRTNQLRGFIFSLSSHIKTKLNARLK